MHCPVETGQKNKRNALSGRDRTKNKRYDKKNNTDFYAAAVERSIIWSGQ